MDKHQIALYLSEHPEFFKDFPDLLQKIKTIEPKDLPDESSKTINISNRILERVQEDNKTMKVQIKWFLDLLQNNESLQENLFEIEKVLLTSPNIVEMIRQFRKEVIRRFNLPAVLIFLVDGQDHFIHNSIQDRLQEDLLEGLIFVEQETLDSWFSSNQQPVLREDLQDGSALFKEHYQKPILSEALVPIIRYGKIAGALCFGSTKPKHFYEGLRTDYLERTAEKLGIGLDNVLLHEILKMQEAWEGPNGFMKTLYLRPLLDRYMELAKCTETPLSCIKLVVDYSSEVQDTYDEPLEESLIEGVGEAFQQNTLPDKDLLFFSGDNVFWMLLPRVPLEGARRRVKRIRESIKELNSGTHDGKFQFNFGVSTITEGFSETSDEFLEEVSQSISKTQEAEAESLIS